MFKSIFSFELNYRLRQPMVYVFFLINFFLVFSATVSEDVVIGGSGGAQYLNSPFTIMSLSGLMTVLGIFMTAAFMTTAILRDFTHQYDGILFSTPIKKGGYLGGRFFGALLMALVPFLGVFAGIALGSVTPWVDESQAGPFALLPYVETFFLMILPNTLLIGAVVFLLAALFKSSIVAFVGAMAILVAYTVMISVGGDLDNEYWAILLDPLGINSYEILTKYWTVNDKNTLLISSNTLFLLNRLIWFVVSFLVLAVTYFRFSFTQRKQKTKKGQSLSQSPQLKPVITQLKALPQVTIDDSTKMAWLQFWHQVKMEFWGVAKSTPFLLILSFGILNMMGSVPNVNEWYGTGNHPVTYLVVDAIRGTLYLFIIAILMYYAGVLVWKEREAKMNEFFDAAPFPTWVPFTSKLLALVGLVAIILIIAILFGMTSQALNGYTHFELGIYLREFLVYDLLQFIGFIILALTVQVLINNKYLAYFVFLVIVIAAAFGPAALKVNSNLFGYMRLPNYIYSDMNAWNDFAKSLHWFFAYWLFFAGILALGGVLFWVRGKALSFGQRQRIARQRFDGKMPLLFAGLAVLWFGTGSFLFYQTKVVNTITHQEEQELKRKTYELKYKQYQDLVQPRIVKIENDLALFPEKRNLALTTKITAQNKSEKAIQQIHFTIPEQVTIDIDLPNASIEQKDDYAAYWIYNLQTPLHPGDSLTFSVHSTYQSKGIENELEMPGIVDNGTFLHSNDLLPTIGYDPNVEISSKRTRKGHQLPERERANKLHANCSHACSNSYISTDSDWVNISSTISTSADQIAIAPGTLVKEWEEEGRRYYQYVLKKPVLNFYAFISARYEVLRDTWTAPSGEKVDVEVYYNQGHKYNVEKMSRAVKDALTYCANNFLPYPHEQARIIEFPRYENFAQAFPGTMPYSESLGFIANLNEADAIDMVTYVVAHEIAHQWWAHQVIGARMQGATMLSETFAQYSALMVMKKRYGTDKMKQFLRYEMDAYLRARGGELEKELPLKYVEDQGYVHYRKGSVIMYTLQDFIGEDRLNQALSQFAQAVAYQEAPYTNSLEVMDYIEAVTPDSLEYLLEDMFNTITLYSNKTTQATYKALDNGQYEVKVDISIEKFRADSLGKESLIPHHDFVDIGIFSEQKEEGHRYGRPILVERHQVSAKDTSFTFIVDEMPYEAGIDPNYLLIDRFPEDNVKRLELE